MTLDQIKRGQMVKILSIPDDETRAKAIRFGIAEGEIVLCAEVVPFGPIVLQKNKQEIAMGRNLAASINVVLINSLELSA